MTMCAEKLKIKFRRWFWFAVMVVCAIVFYKDWGKAENSYGDSYVITDGTESEFLQLTTRQCVCVISCGVALGFWIVSLISTCKKYQFSEWTIIVYAGKYHRYIKIDDELYDEHNTLMNLSPIYLSCEVEGHKVEATISVFNRITLKIDGKLQQ